jgi:hypothetical protein
MMEITDRHEQSMGRPGGTVWLEASASPSRWPEGRSEEPESVEHSMLAEETEMVTTIVSWIAAVVGAVICAYFAVGLMRKLSATVAGVEDQAAQEVARVEDQVAHEQAKAEDEVAHQVRGFNTAITRVQHQFHVPDFPGPRRRPAD